MERLLAQCFEYQYLEIIPKLNLFKQTVQNATGYTVVCFMWINMMLVMFSFAEYQASTLKIGDISRNRFLMSPLVELVRGEYPDGKK